MVARIFCLMGPTASGKTGLACQLVKQFPFEIISVDSAMIYRGMNIGTAKPTSSELAAAPHHLIDIIDPVDSFSAAQFCEETLTLCAAIFNRGKIPLLVGGTMMYFHALQQGLSVLPEADESLRAALLLQAEQQGWEAMHTRLTELDPIAGAKINPHDSQRIQRALEVMYLTGKSLTSLLREPKKKSPYCYMNLLLMPNERAWLHERIACRFDSMLQQGFIQEVETLLKTWQLPLSSPAMRCVGYRQAFDYLSGTDDYAAFCSKAIAATRQLAKRQLTWLRQWPESQIFACDSRASEGAIVAIINKILDNHAPITKLNE